MFLALRLLLLIASCAVADAFLLSAIKNLVIGSGDSGGSENGGVKKLELPYLDQAVKQHKMNAHKNNDLFNVEHVNNRIDQGQLMVAKFKEDEASWTCVQRHRMSFGNCDQLTHSKRSLLASLLTNCQLMHSGLDPVCERTTTLKQCIHAIGKEPMAWTAYNSFFVSIDTICNAVEGTKWKARTTEAVTTMYESIRDNANVMQQFTRDSETVFDRVSAEAQGLSHTLSNGIEKLTNGQRSIGEHVSSSLELQNELLSKQQQAQRYIAGVQQLLNSTREAVGELREEQVTAFREAQVSLQALIEDSRQAEKRLRDLVAEVQGAVEHAISLDYLVLGELFSITSVAYYIASLLSAVLLTSTPRTKGARFPLLLVVAANLVTERLLPPTHFTELVPVVRKVFCFLGLGNLVWAVWSWRDYDRINHELLLSIMEKLSPAPSVALASHKKKTILF